MPAADRLTSGQYEFTTTTDGKTQTLAHCVTPEEARSVNGDAKAGREYAEKDLQRAGCSITTYDVIQIPCKLGIEEKPEMLLQLLVARPTGGRTKNPTNPESESPSGPSAGR
jgi:hypothetical protein